ncbi:hypothetical protein HYH02_009813 [Chlamydomonas schloesseri]|uniref:Cyclic nucleotide-binding domain-containing protein n=1 Tax=Chlamydomonas schloesseri TaxID=2026947 RepID=A0A835TDE0_9CHLO|nr:hypothetical protein HYH02_009813 [Chlamydomonas schloesseri]|eukprot:KAG2442021.1 hypothetical protein HYH02_009813 [Chlamydomonas schloesseri]
MNSLTERQKQDDEHRTWVKQRFDVLEQEVREAVSAASASAAAASAASRSAGALASAAGNAGSAPATSTLLKSPSFEFVRTGSQTARSNRFESGGGFGGLPAPGAGSGLARLPESPAEGGSLAGGSQAGDDEAVRAAPGRAEGARRGGGAAGGSGGGGGGVGLAGAGTAVNGKPLPSSSTTSTSPTRRFRLPLLSSSDAEDDDDSIDGGTPSRAALAARARLQRARSKRTQALQAGADPAAANAAGGGPGAGADITVGSRIGQPRSSSSPFAASRQQDAVVASGYDDDEPLWEAGAGEGSRRGRRGQAGRLRQRELSTSMSGHENGLQDGDGAPSLSLPDSATDVGGPSDGGYGRGRGRSLRQSQAGPEDMLGTSHGSLRHWHSHGTHSLASSLFPTLGTASVAPSSAHEGQHLHHSLSQHSHGSHQHSLHGHHGLHHSNSHGHGHGHHGHTHSHGHGHAHPFFGQPHHSSRTASGQGNVATLFPSMGGTRQTSGGDEAFGLPPLSPGGAPPSLPQVPMSPRSGGGGGVSERGRDGMEAAPSLARESMRSRETNATERPAEVEEASLKHFKGIPPRLVEIYRQRALTSHWSLANEVGLLSRAASRRGSMDMVRPAGLIRQAAQAAAAAAAAAAASGNGTENGGVAELPGGGRGLSRIALLHASGAGSGKATSGGGGGGGKEGGGGKDANGHAYEDLADFEVIEPGVDYPRMIGDDADDYDRPMSLKERLTLYSVGLIRPEGRTKWDLFILALLVWVLFASPVIICFGLTGDIWHGDWLGIIELTVDLAFLFDIYLNFRTAYYDSKGHLVTERWRIARHYLRTWFVLDVICVIPYDLITAGTMGFLSMLKLLRVMRVGKVIRMIKMYRLLRVIRLPRIIERMEMFIDRGVLQVLAFILSVCLMAHLSACVFYYMAYLDGLGPNTWVAAYGVEGADLATRYLTSLYWAFTTTATVGYGDITPKTDKEKIIAIFVMCMGVSVVGYVTSSISNIMAIKNAQQTNIAAKKQLVMDVLKGRSIPGELSRRVYNYFDYVSSKMIRKDESELLQELPFKLRSRMLQAIFADTLSRIPAISRLPPHVLIELVAQLKPRYFVEGDIVAMQGDYVDALYFVSEGLLEVRTYMFPADVEPWRIFEAVHKDELRHMPYTAEGRLKPRCYFGQAGVLHSGVWPGTVIARNCCELYGLEPEGLEHMVAIQPELQEMLGIPKAPLPACAAHATFLSGPGANPLLPPTDRAVLLADFPIMDAAPRRGLMQNMFRSMGHMITGGLARASASHYPHMPVSAWGAGGGGGGAHAAAGGGGGVGSLARSSGSIVGVWGSVPHGASGGGGGEGGAPGASGAGGLDGESTFSRFRHFTKPSRLSVQLPEHSRLLNGGERSDSFGGGSNRV